MRDHPPNDLPTLRRVHFFDGRLLTAADLRRDQEDHRAHARLHNRLLHGWGVVSGLEVRSTGGTIVVTPGVALDPAGNTIVLCDATRVTPAPPLDAPTSLFVVIRHHEQLADPMPVGAQTEFAWVVEGAVVGTQSAVTRPPDTGVTLARLLWRTSQWRVDGRYRRRRVRT